MQPQYFSDFAHGQPGIRQSAPRQKNVEHATVDPRRCVSALLFAFPWKPCSFCRGIGVRFAVEFVFAFAWNQRSLCRGIFNGVAMARV
jgi:hypothetical protein